MPLNMTKLIAFEKRKKIVNCGEEASRRLNFAAQFAELNFKLCVA